MRKNTTTPLLKDCIVQSLLRLLQEKQLEEVSVMEIVEKAGVNRSTYYRHFKTKHDVVRHFYAERLDEYLTGVQEGIAPLEYFTGMFESFLRYKNELLLLDLLGLSYLLLEEMNSRIPEICAPNAGEVQLLYCRYHIGGVFNSFRFWLAGGMSIPPRQLAGECMQILPRDFSPWLMKRPPAGENALPHGD